VNAWRETRNKSADRNESWGTKLDNFWRAKRKKKEKKKEEKKEKEKTVSPKEKEKWGQLN